MSGAARRTERRRRRTGVGTLIGVVAIVTACSSGGTDNDAGGTSGTGGGGAPAALLTGPITVTTDSAAQQAVEIGPDGGTVDVENVEGDRFRLNVPEGALLSTVTITMAPTMSIGNTGFEAAGVVFGPSGTQFLVPARLDVTPHEQVPSDEGFVFTFSDDGSQFGAAEPAPDGDGVSVVVPHFSGYAFGTPTGPERAAFLNRQATDAATRLSSRMNELLADRGAAPADVATAMQDLLDQWDEQVVRPRLEAAGASCAAAKEAIAAVLTAERQRALLGQEAGATDVAELVRQAYPLCEKEAVAECRAAGDPSILLRFWLGVNRIMQLNGQPDIAPSDPEEATRRCSTSYRAEGGTDEVISGIITDLDAPFTLEGVIDGGTTTYSYSGGMTGTVTLSGSGSDAVWEGEGTYSITENDDGTLTMTHTNSWCLLEPVASCAPSTEVLTLTPVD